MKEPTLPLKKHRLELYACAQMSAIHHLLVHPIPSCKEKKAFHRICKLFIIEQLHPETADETTHATPVTRSQFKLKW